MLDSTPTSVEAPTANTGRNKGLANLRPFQPGQSGNPRGRPKKDIDLAALAQKHAESAVLALAEIVVNGDAPPSARVSAAAELLDRGFGRAPASLDVKHTMTIGEEFEAFVRQLTGRPARVIEADAEELSNVSQNSRASDLARAQE